MYIVKNLLINMFAGSKDTRLGVSYCKIFFARSSEAQCRGECSH